MTDPLFRFFYGPDYMRDDGFILWLVFAPARRLMTPREEGTEELAGLCLTVHFLRPLSRWGHWRFPIQVRARSDAGEIATRIARSAGQIV